MNKEHVKKEEEQVAGIKVLGILIAVQLIMAVGCGTEVMAQSSGFITPRTIHHVYEANDSLSEEKQAEFDQHDREWEEHMRQTEAYMDDDEYQHMPHHVFKVHVGPTTAMKDLYYDGEWRSAKIGKEYGFQYHYYWHNFWGAGLSIFQADTPLKHGITIKTTFIGPSFGFHFMESDKTHMNASISLGSVKYTERWRGQEHSSQKFGVIASFSIEHKFSKHVGLGCQLNYGFVYLRKPKGIDLDPDEEYGWNPCSFLFGPRFYF